MRLAGMLGAALALLVCPGAALAQASDDGPDRCVIQFDSAKETHDLFAISQLNFAGFDRLCPLLREAGMGVSTSEARGHVGDRTFGLVVLTLYDRTTNAKGWKEVTSTSFSEDLGEGRDGRTLLDAINRAMQNVADAPDEMIASVYEELARLRVAAAQPAALPGLPRNPCRVRYNTSRTLDAMILGWGDEGLGSEELCNWMAASNAGLRLTEDSGEVGGRSFAWVMISLMDNATELSSSYRSTTIFIDNGAGGAVLESVMHDALTGAVDRLESEPDVYFASLAAEVTQIRSALALATTD